MSDFEEYGAFKKLESYLLHIFPGNFKQKMKFISSFLILLLELIKCS